MEYGGLAEEELQADEYELRKVLTGFRERADMLSVFLTATLGGYLRGSLENSYEVMDAKLFLILDKNQK